MIEEYNTTDPVVSTEVKEANRLSCSSTFAEQSREPPKGGPCQTGKNRLECNTKTGAIFFSLSLSLVCQFGKLLSNTSFILFSPSKMGNSWFLLRGILVLNDNDTNLVYNKKKVSIKKL